MKDPFKNIRGLCNILEPDNLSLDCLCGTEMGDRYYEQQKKYKPKRRLKKDVIADLEQLLGCKLDGLDRTTIACIEALTEAIERKLLQ